jgi:hypothetical protein
MMGTFPHGIVMGGQFPYIFTSPLFASNEKMFLVFIFGGI